MAARVTTAQIWMQLEKQLFGVVGLVTAKGEARTAGIAYLVRDKKLYFCTDTDAWKTKHLRNNPNVSMTIPIPKRVPFMPWIKIPAATITFSGTGRVLSLAEVPAEIPDALLKDLEPKEELRQRTSVVEIAPKGDFMTYGVGVAVKKMLRPTEAGGRAAVE
ncbi:MAG: pyridoxamine 5'-phosphate oxidase family protein [Bacteroidota bacterium]